MNQWVHSECGSKLPQSLQGTFTKKYNYRGNYLPVLGPDQNIPVVVYTVISVYFRETGTS